MTRRPAHEPPADLSKRDLNVSEIECHEWFRIHPQRYDPEHFSYNEHHRFSPISERPKVLYAASDPETALMEVFGDTIFQARTNFLSLKRWDSLNITAFALEGIRVCDLTHPDTVISLGVDFGTLMGPEIELCQRWADALFHHSDKPDALIYKSRFTFEPCITLSEKVRYSLIKANTTSLNSDQRCISFLSRHEIGLI